MLSTISTLNLSNDNGIQRFADFWPRGVGLYCAYIGWTICLTWSYISLAKFAKLIYTLVGLFDGGSISDFEYE